MGTDIECSEEVVGGEIGVGATRGYRCAAGVRRHHQVGGAQQLGMYRRLVLKDVEPGGSDGAVLEACANAPSSTMPPRATLTSVAVRFIRASCGAPIRWRTSALYGSTRMTWSSGLFEGVRMAGHGKANISAFCRSGHRAAINAFALSSMLCPSFPTFLWSPNRTWHKNLPHWVYIGSIAGCLRGGLGSQALL